MKIRWIGCALLIAVGIGFLAGNGFTDEPGPSEEEQMKAFMDTMLELGKPTEKHAVLKRMVGDWDVITKMWPSGKLQSSKGTSSGHMLLGGRFLHTSWHGKFMEMDHDGIAVMGHDNIKQTYFSQWYDSMSSGVYTMAGTMAQDGKALTMTGEWEGPGGMKMATRMVYTFKDADTFIMEHYTLVGEKEVRDMEMAYTRAKPKANGRCCPPGSKGPGY